MAAGSSSLVGHIPHLQQVATWDCGLACVSMVLTALSIAHTHADLLDADDGAAADADGLWTIDLAYLLRKFGVRDFTYYTSYIGVNQRYTHSLFYARTLPSDRRRIHALFQRAAENRVRVVAHTLPVLDIVRFVDSGLYACVVLVDLRRLRCRWCSGWTKRFWRGLWGGRRPSPTTTTTVGVGGETAAAGRDRRGSATPLLVPSSPVVISPSSPSSPSKASPAEPTASTSSFCFSCFKSTTKPPYPEHIPTPSSSTPTPPRYPTTQPQPYPQPRPRAPSSTHPSSPARSITPLPTATPTSSPPRLSPSSPPPHDTDFIGHYILLVAYDESTDSFLYRDPGTHEELCAVSVDGFEAARKAVGTDCDVVVVRVVEG